MTMSKRETFFSTIFMLLFLICSSESLLVGTNSSSIAWAIYTKAHYVVLCLLIARLMVVKGIKINKLYPVLLVATFTFINFIFADGHNVLSTYLHICTVIINAWLIVQQFSFEKFATVFEKAMFVMAVYSLIVYAIALMAPQIIRSLPVIENIAGNRYYCAGLAIISKNGLDSGTLFRSFGIFREPGMYQIFLNISFCIYLFYQKGASIFKIALYILAVFSTISTTGIATMLLIFVIFTIASKTRRKWLIVSFLLMAVVLLYSLTSRYDIFLNAVTKIENQDDSSTVARLYSIIANIKIWLSNPILGSGMDLNSQLFPRLIISATGVEVADNTNTYMYILSCFGIVPFSIFIIGLYRASKTIIKKHALLLLVVFLMLLAGENLLYSSFAWIFAFYGYARSATAAESNQKSAISLESV